jgi:hypothetical protein
MSEVLDLQPQAKLVELPTKRELIEDALRTDPRRSDREIARIVGCDHKTVGAARAKLSPSISPSAPTPTETRDMLIEGCKDFDKRYPPGPSEVATAEEAVDNAIADGKVSTAGAGDAAASHLAQTVQAIVDRHSPGGRCPPPPGTVDKPPEWDPFEPGSDALIVPPQPAIAVYANNAGSISIRQPADDYTDDDLIIVIRPEHVDKLIARLRKVAAEASR